MTPEPRTDAVPSQLAESGPLDADLAFAHQLADAASRISLLHFRSELKQWNKADGSLVTAADLAVETELRAMLGRERPDDAILGEEQGASGSGPRRWILDAIDGTVDFAAGTPNWCTLIALERDGQIVVGVCDQPAHRRRYWAARGQGAYCREGDVDASPQRLQVSGVATLADAHAFLPRPEWQPNDRARRIATVAQGAAGSRPWVTHPALQVATGGFELTLFLAAGTWDLAAPLLVVEEAGGRFTDVEGRYDWTTGTALFSNGRVHDEFLARIANEVAS